MKDIIQSISHFQGELTYNLNQHKERFFHLEYDLGKAVKKLNLSTYLRSCGATKTKGYPLVHLLFAMILLPFVKKSFTALWQHFIFLDYLKGQEGYLLQGIKISKNPMERTYLPPLG